MSEKPNWTIAFTSNISNKSFYLTTIDGELALWTRQEAMNEVEILNNHALHLGRWTAVEQYNH